jgi:hypothetical protein
MKQKLIQLDNERVYIINIPETGSEGEIDPKDKIILDLYNKINKNNIAILDIVEQAYENQLSTEGWLDGDTPMSIIIGKSHFLKEIDIKLKKLFDEKLNLPEEKTCKTCKFYNECRFKAENVLNNCKFYISSNTNF